jgi:hypothetical protein
MRKEGDEDDPPLIFLTKRYGLLLLGSTWAATGPVVGWNGGLLGQVMSFSFFSFLFLFSVLYLQFEFIFEFNTVCKYFVTMLIHPIFRILTIVSLSYIEFILYIKLLAYL